MDLRSELVFAFNTFFGDFLRHAKDVDDTIKRRLKKRYRVIDRASNAALLDFCRAAGAAGAYAAVSCCDEADPLLSSEGCLAMHVAQAMPLADLVRLADERTRATLAADLALMCGVARMYSELLEPGDGVEDGDDGACADSEACMLRALFERFMDAVARFNSGGPAEAALEGIVDDELGPLFRGALVRLRRASGEPAPADAAAGMEEIMEQMRSSKLGLIAEEVSQSIDREKLAEAFAGSEGVESVVRGLLSGENVGLIGDLVQQVGERITTKIQGGELSEDELLRDAFALMSRMRGFGSQ